MDILKYKNFIVRYSYVIILLALFIDSVIYIYKYYEIKNNKILYVGVINLDKPLMKCNSFYEECIDSNKFKILLEKAKPYKVLLLKINCPGGEFYEVYKIINILRKKKEVYSLIESYAFSGCYWVAIYTKKIFAYPYSLVGSIGVKSGIISFHKLLKKLGIEYEDISFGKYKSVGDSFKNITKEDISYLKNLTYQFYLIFLNDVVKKRKIINKTIINEIGQSKIYFSYQAKNLKLIDFVIKDIDDLKNYLKKKYHSDTVEFIEIKLEENKDILSKFLYNLISPLRFLFRIPFSILT